jgi:hypothetical protein
MGDVRVIIHTQEAATITDEANNNIEETMVNEQDSIPF